MKPWLLAAAIAALSFGGVATANADLFVPGSNFTVSASNSPTSFSESVALTPGTHSLNSGSLSLNLSIVPAGGGAEWLVFDYTSTSGALSCPGCNWSLNQTGLDASVPVNFISAYTQWSVNGVVQTPTTSIFGGYVVGANPVPGSSGTGLVNSGFTAPFPAGPLPALGAFMDPWDSYITAMGMDPTKVNGYEQALEFTPQTPVPEPGSLALFGTALFGIGALRWSRRRI